MLTDDWNIVLSLPGGLVPGGMTSWALRTAGALAGRRRNVVIVSHATDKGIEFETKELSLSECVRVVHLPSLECDANDEANLRGYASLLPAVLVPTTIEQSFEIAAILSQTSPSQLRIVAWNHSDHTYDYDCIAHLEPACHAFITNTTACTSRLSARIPNRTDEIAQVPHWIEPTRASRSATDGPVRIGYAGRLEASSKRVSDLLAVARILRDRGRSFEMRIMGEGPECDRLARGIESFHAETATDSDASDSGIPFNIRLLSPRPPNRMSEFWLDCDCLLLPSAYEGLNLQMLEAMACGCIPIVSRVASGPADFIDENANGLTFEVGDVEAAADCVCRLSDSAELRGRLSRNAQRTIEEKCDRDTTVDQLDACIRVAIESPSRPWPRTRPISMRAAELSQADDAAARMRNAFDVVARNGCRSVAIYGAGRHSRMIESAFIDARVPIRAFIDDDPANHGASLWHWPIVSLEAALELDIDAVIISSRMNEAQIMLNGRRFADAGVELIPLYQPTTTGVNSARLCRRRQIRTEEPTTVTTPVLGVASR